LKQNLDQNKSIIDKTLESKTEYNFSVFPKEFFEMNPSFIELINKK